MNKQSITLVIAVCALVVAVAPLALFLGYAVPVLRRIDNAHAAVEGIHTAAASSPVVGLAAPERFHKEHHHEHHHEEPKLAAPAPAAVDAAPKSATTLPARFLAGAGLPRYYQEDRGTCWAFGTIGFLEENYRINGVNKGFLKAGEYVRLSQQAYGISMIESCKNRPDVCDVVGDFVYQNDTDGGEVWWLYHLTDLYTKILPHSVCPYDPSGAHQHECQGMDYALKTNPLSFQINSMSTAYTIQDTKKLLVEKHVPLSWSSQMFSQVYYFSCDEAYWSSRPECSDSQAVPCPTDRYYGGAKRCATIQGSMFDMDGEFVDVGEVVSGGGHAMLVHGYNDEYVTKTGAKGGFIIKNSWHDLAYGKGPAGRGARGSHSVAYWMNEISAWDEKAICPGPLNPENWLSCVQLEAGPHGDFVQKKSVGDTYDISGTCLNKPFMSHLLEVSMQPTEFQCVDSTVCHVGDSRYRYFLIDMHRTSEQHLAKVCMLEYDTYSSTQKTICTPFLIPSQLAYIFKPVQAQLDKLVDNEDLCGYWFWSYQTMDKIAGLYNNYFSTYFDINWNDSSYLANAAKYPTKDYSYVKSSTGTLQQFNFLGPSPFALRRY